MLPFQEVPPGLLAGVRVLALDVDDTITSAGKLPPRTLDLFQALKGVGIAVALVTGRPAGWAQALAVYLPAVRVAVGENGLVAFDAAGVQRDLGPPRAADFFARLSDNARRLALRLDLRPTDDDAFRLFERTFERPSSFDAQALVDSQRLVDPDFEVIASSIHIHVRLAGWGKADGLLAALAPLEPAALADPDSSILFVGDSSNDRPMFARFRRTSVGVANVARFLGELGPDRPAYVTRAEAAAGFAEVAERLIGRRAS
jgi:HAD superfamily hydrolase (TIGR01484 family)